VHLKSKFTALAVAAVAIAGAGALALGSAGASTVAGTEYTNAGVNPVAGYLVQSVDPTENVTQVSSYIGSGNSHSLAALPEGVQNGFGIEVCDHETGEAIQVGVVHTGVNTMDVDYAVGDLGLFSDNTQVPSESNANVCQNGVLGGGIGGKDFKTFFGGVKQLLVGVPINDTVSVQLTFDNGDGRNSRHNPHYRGDWLVTGQVVPNGEYTTYAGGLTEQTAWVVPGSGSFDDAGFGTEANFAQALTPLANGSTVISSEAHMRAEYDNDGSADYTFTNLPGFTQLLGVDSTSNGDSPGDGGITYIAPSSVKADGFSVSEGGLVS
jgi:hypothetical protein